MDLLGARVFAAQVVDVVGRDDPDAVLLGERRHAFDHALLFGEPVSLNLEIEAVGGKDLTVFEDLAAKVLFGSAQGSSVDFARETGAHADEAAGVLAEDVLVDPRLVVEPIDVGHRREAHEVAVTFLVPREQREVEERAPRRPLLLEPAPRGDVGLHADDRPDAFGSALPIELDRPEEVAVIGEGERVHAALLRRSDELRYRHRSVEEAEVAVDVQVDEVRSRRGHVVSLHGVSRAARPAGEAPGPARTAPGGLPRGAL